MKLLAVYRALCVLLALVMGVALALGEESRSETAEGVNSDNETTGDVNKHDLVNAYSSKPVVKKDHFDVKNENWGSYYDPQNIFCGKFDCYKILGFDYESFGKNPPDTKVITKRYRRLSREWHPDKSKHKNAKDRFVKIARAYEVLTSAQQRAEYDMMRYNQEAYYMKYGTSVLWSYAPQTDVTIVVLLVFVALNAATWFGQKHRWQLVADRLVKATVEDWSLGQGGSPESKHLREEALVILAEQEKEAKAAEEAETAAAASNTTKSAASVNAKKKSAAKTAKKLSIKEKKQLEQEALFPIVKGLVYKMDDFGGGFHKPTWEDLFAVHMVRIPYHVSLALLWNTKYWIRRLQKQELNDEEKQVLTERAVGPVAWNTATDEEKEGMVKKELWIKENMVEWQEEQEVRKLSAAEQKQYMKMKKKGKIE